MAQEDTKAEKPDQAAQPVEDKVEADTEWTVMAYLAGDNNLNEEMVLTLQEFHDKAEEESLWPRIKLLARLDPSGMGLPTEGYAFNTEETIEKNPDARYFLKHYREDIEFDPEEDNTGNPHALSNFVKGSVNQHNEDKKGSWALILSGHGSGTTEDFLGQDDSSLDSMSIKELEIALENARDFLGVENETASGPGDERSRIDLFGMDACFMSMLEVYFQIRHHVKFVVGAESMVPDFGWPYHRIIRRAEEERAKNGGTDSIDPGELAKIIVREFIEYYSDYDRTAGRSVDLAAIRIFKRDSQSQTEQNFMWELAASVHHLAAVLIAQLKVPASVDQIHLAHLEAQTYKYDQFVDLRDFCVLLRERFERLHLNIDVVGAACQTVIDKLDACVLLAGCSGFAYQHSYGLSIYFPWALDSTPSSYEGLAFNGEFPGQPTWANFLDEYLETTRREMRQGEGVLMRLSKAEDEAPIRPIKALLDKVEASCELATRIAKRHIRWLAGFRGPDDSSYSTGGSRYSMSRYSMSRYSMSRWPGDREQSVKNFAPVIGKAFWPVETPRKVKEMIKG